MSLVTIQNRVLRSETKITEVNGGLLNRQDVEEACLKMIKEGSWRVSEEEARSRLDTLYGSPFIDDNNKVRLLEGGKWFTPSHNDINLTGTPVKKIAFVGDLTYIPFVIKCLTDDVADRNYIMHLHRYMTKVSKETDARTYPWIELAFIDDEYVTHVKWDADCELVVSSMSLDSDETFMMGSGVAPQFDVEVLDKYTMCRSEVSRYNRIHKNALEIHKDASEQDFFCNDEIVELKL